ncbi:MAG: chemotaxis protein [Lachnospiraceae bacterium]|nr:chemotaxis protein [Lachnospiraceae bacterium]
MNKFLYNNPVERMKRVNRVYLLAIVILFGVLLVYQSMLVKEGTFPDSLESYSKTAMVGILLLDAILFLVNKSSKYLRICITLEVGTAYLFFVLNTPGSFLGMAFVGVLGVSVLYFDTAYYMGTLLFSVVLYVVGQVARVNTGVVSADVNGVCNVIMTFAIFIMFFIINRLSEMFNDHALGAVKEQSEIQMQIMKVITEETSSSTEMVNSLYKASGNIAQSMQDISLSTEKIVENITEQNCMTQNIQNAINNTQEYSSEMVSVATVSNEEIRTNQKMMETLKEQSEQIADNNALVTAAMEQLQDKIDKVDSIANMILRISNQTTILSLNASVESARAGEAGKGFSVVAEQIRQLAEETKDFTKNITNTVEELNVNAKTVVNAMEVSLNAADNQKQMIRTAAEAFDELSGNMNILIKNTQEIGNRIDRLSVANNQIVESITQLSALSEEVSVSAEETNHLTEMNVNYAGQTWESIQKINESTALLKNV